MDLNLDAINVATEGSLQKLDDECTICLEILEEPLQTPCRHLFCSDCIKGVLSALAVHARFCPLCRGMYSRVFLSAY
jgi:SWI/SNF-related matrix-associated actin-dependent regulator of chromatin subfamily A3